MICLAGISCIAESGCLRSAALPPSVSIPHSSTRNMPSNPMLQSSPESLNDSGLRMGMHHPWKPTVPERDWKYLVVHHTASNGGSVESIHQAHLKRTDKAGNHWLGIGYHFVIGNGNGMGDGEIQPTFRWNEQIHGAHAGIDEYNQHGIGIVLVGNFEEHEPTSAQLAAIRLLTGTLKTQYHISAANVVGHGDVKTTACPGRYFPLDDISQVTFAPSILPRTDKPAKKKVRNNDNTAFFAPLLDGPIDSGNAIADL